MQNAGTKMKNLKRLGPTLCCSIIVGILYFSFSTGCGIYRFQDVTVPDSIKTIKINFIENHASYVNPQFSPSLTDRLKQKIVNQTKLSQTNDEAKADWIISGEITEYYTSTSGVTSQNGRSTTSINRLNVSVRITRNEPNKDPVDYTVSRQFDYGASQSLQQAERVLMDEMVRSLSDEIFNRLFSEW
jgi:hypothetical protein